ncbi:MULTISPECIES: pyridoxamine 5'-phosphate oxidase family protein [unclassified Nocardioides]|uniref:pyridoxamine 5'-phosphate oxidase family protein n=1 Tax=unclassified Nocardioides TaxID=2615069 RepID=UPI0009F10A72|nr:MULTISPECIES: pyridoxamine 5'-phosphate oxidase family protein [unclassified Nocardioides]GAW48438.1 Pyridoxamine 5'-phosphate oxidase-related FMN-binding [Nocardioides sp. PD653-B2]GAW53363.1 Pyridoxamine 5'-phosphate oxidase-related FMN-binding [Nocardioides sp. PD653]
MTDTGDQKKLVDLVDDMPLAMLTTFGADGVRSVPMARQEVEPTAEMWFIAARDSAHVRAIQENPAVALTFSSRDAWVSVTGSAAVVDDDAKLEELWNTFAEAWLPGGPEDPNVVLREVDVERGEYWDTPGGKAASIVSLVKSKLTGEPYEAEHGQVDV